MKRGRFERDVNFAHLNVRFRHAPRLKRPSPRRCCAWCAYRPLEAASSALDAVCRGVQRVPTSSKGSVGDYVDRAPHPGNGRGYLRRQKLPHIAVSFPFPESYSRVEHDPELSLGAFCRCNCITTREVGPCSTPCWSSGTGNTHQYYLVLIITVRIPRCQYAIFVYIQVLLLYEDCRVQTTLDSIRRPRFTSCKARRCEHTAHHLTVANGRC